MNNEVDPESHWLSPEIRRQIEQDFAIAASMDDAESVARWLISQASLPELRRRAWVRIYCASCGRLLAFLLRVDGRPLLWSAGADSQSSYRWVDQAFWPAIAECRRCRARYRIGGPVIEVMIKTRRGGNVYV